MVDHGTPELRLPRRVKRSSAFHIRNGVPHKLIKMLCVALCLALLAATRADIAGAPSISGFFSANTTLYVFAAPASAPAAAVPASAAAAGDEVIDLDIDVDARHGAAAQPAASAVPVATPRSLLFAGAHSFEFNHEKFASMLDEGGRVTLMRRGALLICTGTTLAHRCSFFASLVRRRVRIGCRRQAAVLLLCRLSAHAALDFPVASFRRVSRAARSAAARRQLLLCRARCRGALASSQAPSGRRGGTA